jgi:NADH:ubiquinone oxidoreductase 27 kD subunit
MQGTEQEIVNKLADRFAYLQDWCRVTRPHRIFAEVPRQNALRVIAYAKEALHFGSLCTITGLDTGENFQLIYHLANSGGVVLNIKASAPKSAPFFDSVTELYHGAMLYEIEACNLLGIQIKGVPADIKYPLPDDWPDGQYPLRKDWNGQMPDPGQEGEC